MPRGTPYFKKKKVELLFTEYEPFYEMSDHHDVLEAGLHFADLRPQGKRFRILCRLTFRQQEPWEAFLAAYPNEIAAFKEFEKTAEYKTVHSDLDRFYS